jgi:hypothetical protein
VAPATAAPPTSAAAPATAPSADSAKNSRDSSGQDNSKTVRRVAEMGLLTLGVAAIAVGTVEAFRLKSKNEEIQQLCGSSATCVGDYDRYKSLHDDASAARTISWASFGVGGAALAGSALLFFTENSGKTAALGSIAPHFSSQEIGLQWARRW